MADRFACPTCGKPTLNRALVETYEWVEAKGVPVTSRELRDELGLSHPAAANRLASLQETGLLIRAAHVKKGTGGSEYYYWIEAT